ncbi:hypothetical protein [Lentibacillus amyloliquefaciens]|uniref:Uncharacterized protein n=1 Tax=Lentibacillus amyloliquefaciens TaxID=1472767 RepID=A0A0U3WA76_9BACI|nr:hypothetical protein [Lentibacillus amyloliquefaciens]ALX50000.1 hypothetical protein AOX59_16285 [Lentibacillus amyloliquefaciens]
MMINIDAGIKRNRHMMIFGCAENLLFTSAILLRQSSESVIRTNDAPIISSGDGTKTSGRGPESSESVIGTSDAPIKTSENATEPSDNPP